MCILFLFTLVIAVLSVVPVADSVSQVNDLLNQNNLDSTIAFNPDSPQNEIVQSAFSTNPTDPVGSSADWKGLTQSTEHAQMPSVLSDSLATLMTYDPNAPSNPNGSPNSVVPSNPDATLRAPDTTEGDQEIAQEVIPSEGVIPKTVPGAAVPSGGDIILAPGDRWQDVRPGDIIEANPDTVEPDVDEDDVDCDTGTWSFCCWLPAPDPVNGQYSYRNNLKLFNVRRDCQKRTFQV